MRLRDVILRNTRTNQPAATAVATGTIFCVTDEGNILERSNGTAWEAYSPAVGAPGADIEANSTNDVSYTVLAANAGKYHRFTGTGAKTVTFSTAESLDAPEEYHIVNRAASGDITLAGSGITLNAPTDGTLVLNPGMTVTVKLISTTVADVFGQTEPA